MLSSEAATNGTGVASQAALVEQCRDVRENLEGIARALGALREDIDRALHDGQKPSDEK